MHTVYYIRSDQRSVKIQEQKEQKEKINRKGRKEEIKSAEKEVSIQRSAKIQDQKDF